MSLMCLVFRKSIDLLIFTDSMLKYYSLWYMTLLIEKKYFVNGKNKKLDEF